jgi:hypothetical protein
MASPFLSGLASAKWTSLPHRGAGGRAAYLLRVVHSQEILRC